MTFHGSVQLLRGSPAACRWSLESPPGSTAALLDLAEPLLWSVDVLLDSTDTLPDLTGSLLDLTQLLQFPTDFRCQRAPAPDQPTVALNLFKEECMDTQQKQSIEAYQRVQAFLAEHPLPAPATYAEPKELLDDVVARLTTHSTEQAVSKRLIQAVDRRLGNLRRVLREQHLRPIAKVAKAALGDVPAIDRATRMPSTHTTTTKLIAEAAAFHEAIAPYADILIRKGRPTDFLAQLDAAAEDLHQAQLAKARSQGRKVGARAGIDEEIARGRQAVDMLDAIVTTSFVGNSDVLSKWRSAKRVRGLSSGNGGGSDSPGNSPTPVQPTPAQPTSAQSTSAQPTLTEPKAA